VPMGLEDQERFSRMEKQSWPGQECKQREQPDDSAH
jgi:hypothetical protein